MVEQAICRYNCTKCDKELENEGFIAVDAANSELVEKIIDLSINTAVCPDCGTVNRLPIPLIFHDGEKKLLVCYLPGLRGMEPEDIGEAIRVPYDMIVTHATGDLGIELPKPEETPESEAAQSPLTLFASLSQAQAAEILPEYLLQPTVVDGMEVVSAIIQAVRDGLDTREVLDDMARLQLINAIIGAKEDVIERRKILRRNENLLNDELYEVLDTLLAQLESEGNTDMVDKISFVRKEVERYISVQEAKKKKSGCKGTAIEA